MNITESIAKMLSPRSGEKLLKNNTIQIYSNAYLGCYQWRDSNFEETSNQFTNKSFEFRTQVLDFMEEYLTRY